MNLSIRAALWLIGFSFVLYEAKEWNLVSWLQVDFEPAPQFTDCEARALLALLGAPWVKKSLNVGYRPNLSG